MKNSSNNDTKADKIPLLDNGAYLVDKITDEMIRMPIDFDHPNPNWKNQEGVLIVDQHKIDQSICFRGLIKNDYFDALYCLTWERMRTTIFLTSLLKEPCRVDNLFEEASVLFREFEGFPNKPYLSNNEELRKDIFSKGPPNLSLESINDFFTPTPSEEYFRMIGCKFHKVPLRFFVDPSMGKEDFCKQARLQFEKINKLARRKHEQLVEKGYPYLPIKKNKRINSGNLQKLKVLGHYRLSSCMRLGWEKVRGSYGADSYKEERTYREGLKKHFNEYFHKAH